MRDVGDFIKVVVLTGVSTFLVGIAVGAAVAPDLFGVCR